jgi:hypothetical protein
MGNRRSSSVIEQSQDLEARKFCGFLGSSPLRIRKIAWNSDDSIFTWYAKVLFS